MVFTIISDDLNKFFNNPLVKATYKTVRTYLPTEIYLIDSFDKAVALRPEVSFLRSQIADNVYWFENNIDEFIVNYFKPIRDKYKLVPLLVNNIQKNLVNYENHKIDSYIDETENTFYLIDKQIERYFKADVPDLMYLGLKICYRNHFRLKLKQLGFITETYTLEWLEDYLKKLFAGEYWMYILIIFKQLLPIKAEFVADYEVDGEKKNAWRELFKVEEYLNKVKIYGFDTNTLDLNYQRDEAGNYYVQYKYRGSESTTGRIYTHDLDTYQGIQNLPKEHRKALKAEPGCVLVEIDYKSFEYKILASLLQHKTADDPHQEMIDYLFPGQNKDRLIGKAINYSVIYGKSIPTVCNELVEKFPEHNFDFFFDKIRQNPFFASAAKFETILRNHNYNREKMLLKTYFNRWIKIEKDFAILNNFIQATGADFLYMKFNQIAKLLSNYTQKNKILMQNHDSFLFQFEDSVIEKTDLFEQIQAIMTAPYKLIQVDIDWSAGRNWGEL